VRGPFPSALNIFEDSSTTFIIINANLLPNQVPFLWIINNLKLP